MPRMESDNELMQMIVQTFESVSAMGDAQQRFDSSVMEEIARLWKDNAELRDDLHALANRVETLTRARLTEPAEVAERMTPSTTDRTEPPIFVCRLNRGCNVSRPHIHADDGAVIYAPDAETVDNQLGQRAVVRALTKDSDA